MLFICTPNFKDFTFARFEGKSHTKATLSLFGWEHGDTALHTLCQHNLRALKYPENPSDAPKWLKDWAEAFDVEAVTERFFKEYQAIFKGAQDALVQENPTLKTDWNLFTQRLFNRLMFIQFLSKKGWLTFEEKKDYLPALFKKAETLQENFYRDRLFYVFFFGLGTNNNIRAVHDLEQLKKKRGEVPFLNGGLFEMVEGNLDERDAVKIPNSVFQKILFELFAPYNFTVHESTPLEIEVAVDPEMLGKVFERLMNERETKGAFYTPRPIVSFMCKEALKGYLAQTPSDKAGEKISQEKLAKLVDLQDDTAVSLAEAKRLLARLAKLKAVDPACGSGAYLLGMMQELFLLTRLLDTRSHNGKARNDYERKLDIVSNNLYGVDLDKFAINTAMLRLWLSLIVDYRDEETLDRLPPLPNLDFKIEHGDSLSALDPQKLSDLFKHELIDNADALQNKKALFFREASEKKEALKKEIIAEQNRLIIALQDSASPKDSFEWRVQFAEVFKPTAADVTLSGATNFGRELAEANVPGGFHIVIANPPYGLKVSDALRDRYFPKKEGAQSKDTYGLFMARALELLCDGGQFCFIVSDTWRTITSHRPLRKRLMEQTIVHHVIDLPSWVFKATVNTGIVTLTKAKPDAKTVIIAGDLGGLEDRDWHTLENNLRIMAARGIDVQTPQYARYTYKQSLIGTYDNLSFFIASPKLYGLMSDSRFVKLESVADVKVGLQTGDNPYYLRKRAGVRGSYDLLDETKLLTEPEIVALTEDEKKNGVDPTTHGGRHFVPYDKGGESDAEGGWLPNYYVPTGYFIDWSKDSVHRLRTATIADVKRRKGEQAKIKTSDETTRAAVIRNPQSYFQGGVTFSRTGVYAPTYRLNAASVFDTEGSSIISSELEPKVMLALMASRLSRFLIKAYVDHTVHAQVEDLKEMPIPQNADYARLKELVSAIIEKQKTEPRYSYYQHEQKEIDALVYQLYRLDENDIREVEIWFCRRYALLAKAQGVWAEVETKYADYFERAKLILEKPPGYWHSHPVYTLIAEGEGHKLDFKCYLAVDIDGRASSKSVESVVSEIAAFLNTNGGTLLIGVEDSGVVTGIEKDLPLVNKKNNDGFEQKLRQSVEAALSPNPSGIKVAFEPLPEGVVCRVEVPPQLGVTYYKGKGDLPDKVYIRDGNRSIALEGRNLVDWTLRRRG